MSTQISLKDFEEIYQTTYDKTLKFIVCKCSNLDDVNDLLQETYFAFYRQLQKKKDWQLENPGNYILGIANKKLKKYYSLFYQWKTKVWQYQSEEEEIEFEIPDDIDLELETMTRLEAEDIWQFLKRKGEVVEKVFYLYYGMDLKITEIAKELGFRESKVKNILYRTIQEIRKIEGERNV